MQAQDGSDLPELKHGIALAKPRCTKAWCSTNLNLLSVCLATNQTSMLLAEPLCVQAQDGSPALVAALLSKPLCC